MRTLSLSKLVATRAIAVTLAMGAAMLPTAASGQGSVNPTLYVNSGLDTVDQPQFAVVGGLSPDACESADGSEGLCRLRDAIFWANVEPDLQTIEFLDGVESITLNIPSQGAPADVTTGSLDVLADLVINGADVSVRAGFDQAQTSYTDAAPHVNVDTAGQCRRSTLGAAAEGGIFTVGEATCPEEAVARRDGVSQGPATQAGTTLTVNGLSVQGGQAENGGGYLVTAGNALVLDEQAAVRENLAGRGGGIMLDVDSSLTARGGTVIWQNQAESGGGIFGEPNTTIDLQNADLNRNQADVSGGGMASAGEVLIRDSLVVLNAVVEPEAPRARHQGGSALDGGGGIAIIPEFTDDEPPRLRIINSEVSQNTAEALNGGGITVVGASEFELTESLVSDNGRRLGDPGAGEPDVEAPALGAGGIFALNTPVSITDSAITGNRAFVGGAGLVLGNLGIPTSEGGVGGGPLPMTIDRSAVTDNALVEFPIEFPASAFQGGGSLVQAGGGLAVMPQAGVIQATISNSTFDGNIAETGAAISVANMATSQQERRAVGPMAGRAELTLFHTTIVDNMILPGGDPGATDSAHALHGEDDVDFALWNTLIQGEGQACSVAPAPSQGSPGPVVTSLGGNSAGDESCNLTNTGDDQNQTDDPLLRAASPTPHRPLPEGHSAIDAGILQPASTTALGLFARGMTCEGLLDQLGEPRFQNEACDRGAVESPFEGTGVDPTDPPPMPGDPNTPDRVGGPTRLETAVLGSQALFEDSSADTVVLARSDLFPDAQAGAPLAVERSAPLLLTQPDVLSTPTEAEIRRVLRTGGTVVLLGGEAAISSAVADRVAEIGFGTVRYGGLNRFGTAVTIATDGLRTPGTVLLADGGDFHPSIVAGAAAVVAGDSTIGVAGGQVDAAVLLTSGGDMAPETSAYIDTATQTVTTIGSAARQAYPAAPNVGGDAPDDPTLSVTVAETFFQAPRAFGVATTTAFADALSGSSIVASPRYGPGPMLFSQPDGLPGVVSVYVTSIAPGVERSLLLGGTAALSTAVADQVEAALDDGG